MTPLPHGSKPMALIPAESFVGFRTNHLLSRNKGSIYPSLIKKHPPAGFDADGLIFIVYEKKYDEIHS